MARFSGGSGGGSGAPGPTGPEGPQGPAGENGLNGQAGSPGEGFNWVGDWSSDGFYSENDVVYYQGNSYIAVITGSENDFGWNSAPNEGIPLPPGSESSPTNTSWDLMALSGADGTGFNWRGNWDSQPMEPYVAGDVVRYDGIVYLAISELGGMIPAGSGTPTEELYDGWIPVVYDGAQGPEGPEGPEGPAGADIDPTILDGKADLVDNFVSSSQLLNLDTVKPGPRFVLVGTGSLAYYTADGSSQSSSTLPANQRWESVAYGNNTFVTISSTFTSDKAAYSTDGGLSWSASTLPQSGYWRQIAYGNGIFVAVNYNSSSIATSPDGITWTSRTVGVTSPNSVTFGGGKFVIVGLFSNNVYSTNGTFWSEGSSLSFLGNQRKKVAYGNGKYVVVVNDSALTKSAYSTDAITWTEAVIPARNWDRLFYGAGKFFAQEGFSNNAAYSSDGIAWTAFTSPTFFQEGVDTGDTVVAIGDQTYSSTDGANWSLFSTTGGFGIEYAEVEYEQPDPIASKYYVDNAIAAAIAAYLT
jgi:hypothetical protein